MNEKTQKAESSSKKSSSSKIADAFEFNLLIFVGDFLRYLKRMWIFVVVMAIVAAGGELYWSKKHFVPEYKSSVSFAVSALNAGSSKIDGASEYASTYGGGTISTQLGKTFQYVINSDMMAEVIKSDLGKPFINGVIKTSTVESTNIFKISVTSASKQDAYDIVNSIVENYPRVADYVIGDTEMEIYSQPKLADEPVNAMAWKKKTVIAAGIGGFIALLYIAVQALLRRTIKSKSDIKLKFNKDAIVEIPYVDMKKRSKGKKMSLVISPRLPAFAESYRTLKKRIIDKPENKIIAMTSTTAGEGKTTVAFNLAYTLSMNGVKVALVDFDFQKNTVASFINGEDIVPGITDIDFDISRLESIAYVNETDKYLTIYPAGNIKRSVSVDKLNEIIKHLSDKFDYIIIDMPPCGLVAEAGIMTSLADETLFVVRMDYARTRKIKNAVSYLNLCNTNYEIVFNGVTQGRLSGSGKYYSGGYSSKYGYSKHHYGKKYGGYGKKYGYGKSYGYGKNYGYGYGKGYGSGYGYGYGSGYGSGYGYGYGSGYGYGYGNGYGYGYGNGYGSGYGSGYGYGYGQSSKKKKKSSKAGKQSKTAKNNKKSLIAEDKKK